MINKYKKVTIEYVLSMLEDASEFELKYDKVLMDFIEQYIDEVHKELEKHGIVDKDGQILLKNAPTLLKVLREIERKEFYKTTELYWIGYNVITESLLQSAQNTYEFNRNVLFPLEKIQQNTYFVELGLKNMSTMTRITDTYITQRYLQIPWCADGKVYSQRLYGHVANFQSKLTYVLEQGVINNKGFDWMMKAWMKLAHQNAYNASRLLKTETMALWSRISKDEYLSRGVEYVEIVNPEACSAICSEYVGEVIPLLDAELGDELPPYHPNCACCFVVFQEEEEEAQ